MLELFVIAVIIMVVAFAAVAIGVRVLIWLSEHWQELFMLALSLVIGAVIVTNTANAASRYGNWSGQYGPIQGRTIEGWKPYHHNPNKPARPPQECQQSSDGLTYQCTGDWK